MDTTEVALAIFAQLVHAYEADDNSKASPTDADLERVALKAFRWAEAFTRVRERKDSF